MDNTRRIVLRFVLVYSLENIWIYLFVMIFAEEKCEKYMIIWWKNNECTVGKEWKIIETRKWCVVAQLVMHEHQGNIDFTKVDGPDIEPSVCRSGFLFHPYLSIINKFKLRITHERWRILAQYSNTPSLDQAFLIFFNC